MKNLFASKTVKLGLSAIAITALLLVVLILVNSLVGLLPKNITLADASENKMYSISDAAKRDIAKVKDSVSIYLLTSGGESTLSETGIHLDTFLKRAAARNGKLSYNVIDLYTDSAFLSERGIDSSTVTPLSVVVESELRYRYIDSADIFYYYIDGIGKVSKSDAQMYQYYASMYGTTLEVLYQFDGEAQLTSALSYVTSDSLPLIISLTGHGETALTATLKNQLTALGTSFSELATLTIVPGCEMLIINGPTSDISANEASLISQYLKKGGKLMLTTASGISAFPNLTSVLADYGLSYADGVIIDPTQGNYYTYPNWLMPTSNPHSSTAGITSSLLLPSAHAIIVEDTAGINTSCLFNTSSASYIIPVESPSAEKPEGAEEASYPVGVIAETNNGSAIVWFSSAALLDDTANQYAGGGNYQHVTSIASYICDVAETGGSEYKPLTLVTEQLTISGVSRVAIAALVVLIVPLLVLVIGATYCHRRKMR